METKICKSCQSPHLLSNFYKHSGFKDGLHCNCKFCEGAINAQRAKKRARNRGAVEITEKRCSSCFSVKPVNDFFRDAAKKYGFASSCKTCSSARAAAWVDSNTDRDKARRKEWYAKKKASVSSRQVIWKAITNYDQSAVNKRYYKNNKEKIRENTRAYRISFKGRGIKNESGRRRYFKEKRSIPIWADRKAMQAFYSNCPVGMEVDHIIPIHGETVCGLHVLENLQYLSKSENSKKWNRFET